MLRLWGNRHFFRQEFDHMIEKRRKAQRDKDLESRFDAPLRKIRRFSQTFANDKPDASVEPKSALRWKDLFRQGDRKSKNKGEDGRDEKEREGSENSQSDEPSSGGGHGWKGQGPGGLSEGDTNRTLVDPMTITTRDGKLLVENEQETNGPSRSRPPSINEERERPTMGRTHTGWFGLGGGGGGDAKTSHKPRLRTDMIKRVEGGGVGLVNPMGWYHSPGNSGNQLPVTPHQPGVEPGPSILGISGGAAVSQPVHSQHDEIDPLSESPRSMHSQLPVEGEGMDKMNARGHQRKTSEPYQLPKSPVIAAAEDKFPRTRTIAFDRTEEPTRTAFTTGRDMTGHYGHSAGTGAMPRTGTVRSVAAMGATGYALERTATGRRSMSGTTRVMPQTATFNSTAMPRTRTINHKAKTENFGGFPTPFAIARAAFVKVFPTAGEKIKRTLTLQAPTGTGSVSNGVGEDVKAVPYISFDASELVRVTMCSRITELILVTQSSAEIVISMI